MFSILIWYFLGFLSVVSPFIYSKEITIIQQIILLILTMERKNLNPPNNIQIEVL